MPQFKFHTKRNFPNLSPGNHKVTSKNTPDYNCIAWAAGDDTKWWSPLAQYYWPPNVPRERTLDAYKQAFASEGFTETQQKDYVAGIERIVIYTKDGVPTHAARQIGKNRWWSKMGSDADIQHALMGVAGKEYGVPAVFMEKAIN